jgi:Uma2 family endonuclease
MAVTVPFSRVEVAERMSAAEFWRLAPETHKAELIDGVMIVASPAADNHERLFAFLFRLLSGYVEDRDLGEVRGSRTAVELGPEQVYEPDILFVSREREGILQRRGVAGAPDLVIEILSASTERLDRGPKLRGYERAGVAEVWLVDPYGPAGTEFYRLADGMYQPMALDPAGILASTAVPGFRIQVAWLWPARRFIALREALAWIEAG